MLPPPATTRQRILDAACELFLEDGYRIGMDAVARRAGVSKQTVYAHFASKDALFRSAASAMMAPLHETLDPRRSDIGTCLHSIGQRYAEHFGTARMVALGRMLIGQATRFPRIAEAMYTTGLQAVLDRLARCLGEAMERGELRHDDPAAAAELFLAMLDGVDGKRRLFCAGAKQRTAQDEWVRYAVDTFLRAYAPTLPPSPTNVQRNSA